MIVPDGAKLVLDPRDDFPHKPEEVSNYNESVYMNAFDSNRGLGLWFRVGNRVNEGHAEMTVCVYLPDGRVGFMFERPQITNNDQMDAGGLRIDVVEPFAHLTAKYAGKLLILANPSDMLNPKEAFSSNPIVECSFAFDVKGVSPMHGGEIVSPDGSPWALDPETAVFRGHLEQHTSVVGEITIGEETFALDGFGFRDKSWGPRYWQNFYWYKWLPMTFGSDFGFMLAYMGQENAPPHVSGHVFKSGELDPLVSAKVLADYDDQYLQTCATVLLTTQSGREYKIVGDRKALIPLRHRRKQPDGSISHARIAEGMMSYECEGRIGLGMAEFMDLIEDGQPISLGAT